MLENNLDHFNKIYCLHQVTCSQCLFKQQLALPHGPRWSRLHREVPLNSSTYSKGKSHFFPITPSFPKDDWILQSDTPSALWMWHRQVRMHIRLRSDDQTFKAKKVSYTFFMNLQKKPILPSSLCPKVFLWKYLSLHSLLATLFYLRYYRVLQGTLPITTSQKMGCPGIQ